MSAQRSLQVKSLPLDGSAGHVTFLEERTGVPEGPSVHTGTLQFANFGLQDLTSRAKTVPSSTATSLLNKLRLRSPVTFSEVGMGVPEEPSVLTCTPQFVYAGLKALALKAKTALFSIANVGTKLALQTDVWNKPPTKMRLRLGTTRRQ